MTGILVDWDRAADRWWHRASSGLACLVVAQALGWELRRQVGALAVGVLFGGGRFSPDLDQRKPWRWLDRRLPDEKLGDGGPLQHHGITHNPRWPAIAAAAWWVASVWVWWACWPAMACLAWVWHDAGDVLIGRGGSDVRAGVPLRSWGWTGHVGLGWFRSGGLVCRALTVACWAGTGVLLPIRGLS